MDLSREKPTAESNIEDRRPKKNIASGTTQEIAANIGSLAPAGSIPTKPAKRGWGKARGGSGW